MSLRQTGWLGFAEAVVFIGVLLATLVYLERVGALDWGWRRDPDGWWGRHSCLPEPRTGVSAPPGGERL